MRPSSSRDRLSVKLDGLLADAGQTPITLNRLLSLTGDSGVLLVVILLALPFVTPLNIPGLSGVMGGAIVVLAIRWALHLPVRLGRFLGERELPQTALSRVLRLSLGVVRFIERCSKPRWGAWLQRRWAQGINGVFLATMGLVLSLPVPLGNMFPAYAILFTAASILEQDGLVIWFGYFWGLVTFLYCWLLAVGGMALVERLLHWNS